jgi:hypothetical protein
MDDPAAKSRASESATDPVTVLRMEPALVKIRSRQRVAEHGEVFTPDWIVEDMLDAMGGETERIDSRVLEPACGSGNFLVAVLRRKLASVITRYGKSEFEKRHQALFALMSVYGIELLADNVAECRENLLRNLAEHINLFADDQCYRAAEVVLGINIIQGDAMAMTDGGGQPLVFAEWAYLGMGKYQRRDFRFRNLAGTLFPVSRGHEALLPVADYRPMTVREIAGD